MEAMNEVAKKKVSDSTTAIGNPFSMHSEVREMALSTVNSMNNLEKHILPSMWESEAILPVHRHLLLLWKMRTYMSDSVQQSFIDLFSFPERHDDKARAARDELAMIMDSLMERDQYDSYGDERKRDRAVNMKRWLSIASLLKDSSTFSTEGFPPHFLSAAIPVAFSTTVMNIMNPARSSHAPTTGTLKERLDAKLLDLHRAIMWQLLRGHWEQLFCVVMSPLSPYRGEGENPWRGRISREVANDLFDVLVNWAQEYRTNNDIPGVRYYNEHAGYFTMDNILTFGKMIQEYNLEWAMAGMEWR